jgi:hypothetical protein
MSFSQSIYQGLNVKELEQIKQFENHWCPV